VQHGSRVLEEYVDEADASDLAIITKKLQSSLKRYPAIPFVPRRDSPAAPVAEATVLKGKAGRTKAGRPWLRKGSRGP